MQFVLKSNSDNIHLMPTIHAYLQIKKMVEYKTIVIWIFNNVQKIQLTCHTF